jgi:hypothetical protein
MENRVEQLEDMATELTKDMNIPPINNSVAEAARTLGSKDGNITKDVFDTALANMDYLPIFTMGQDPVLTALTGQGQIDGKWQECNQVTRDLGKELTAVLKKHRLPEEPPEDKYAEQFALFEEKQQNLFLELINALFWNVIWAKFIVDMAIINPLRTQIANPLDGLILFFKAKCFRPWFSIKSKKCLEKNGPINKGLNRLRQLLLCKIPPKAYPRYKPMVEIDCRSRETPCPPERSRKIEPSKKKGSIQQLGEIMDEMDQDPCISSSDFLKGFQIDLPDKLGASPECAKAAKVVLDAIVADALQPKNSPLYQSDNDDSYVRGVMENNLQRLGG